VTSDPDRLTEIFRQLHPQDQQTVIAFAEFLAGRGAQPAPANRVKMPQASIPEPELIPRPDGETIVAGLKRLSRTYPMLDKAKMLNATSDLVARSLMQGRDASAVIDELEEIFSTQYRQLKDASNS
jgi:hypothetical protein